MTSYYLNKKRCAPSTGLSIYFAWSLVAAFCILWIYFLVPRTLVPTDEGRYAEMGREMAQAIASGGDWITPRLNGIKYFEKPPLQTWMNALTFLAFGQGEWQARLWTGLCGLFGIVLTVYTGSRVFGSQVGYVAGLVLASSFLWAAMAHVNTLDMGLACMMTVALCALLVAQSDGTPQFRRNWMLACWAGMALAVLSKGLIGVALPGAVLVIYTLASRDWSIWKRLHLLPGLLIFFAIVTPWFVLVSLKNPEFARFFFIHEHFQRFTSNVHHREGAWYYFIPILLLGLMPWTLLLFHGLLAGVRDRAEGFQAKKLLLCWSVFIFFFFSISGSKLPSYILPVFPALALLIADVLDRAQPRAVIVSASIFALICATGLILSPKVPALAKSVQEAPLFQAYVPYVIASTVLGLLGALAAIRLSRRRMELAVAVLAGAGFLSGQIMLLGHDALGRYAAGVQHLPAIQLELGLQTPIYAVGRYEHVLPFYLQRTLTLVEHADEMEFGLQQEPERWIPTIPAFLAKWQAHTASREKAVAILRPDLYSEFQKLQLPMRVIAQDARRIIVTNQ